MLCFVSGYLVDLLKTQPGLITSSSLQRTPLLPQSRLWTRTTTTGRSGTCTTRREAREKQAIARNFGPGSQNRARSMQREGKGPRPKSCTRDRGDDNSRGGGAVP